MLDFRISQQLGSFFLFLFLQNCVLDVYSMIIHYRQEVETTLVTIDRGMDKENVVYIYNKKLFSL